MLSKRLSFIGAAVFIVILFFSSGVFPANRAAAASGFVLPATVSTYGNAWDGVLAFALNGPGPDNELIVMKTDGNVLYSLQSTTGGDQISKNIAQDTLLFTGDPQPGGVSNVPSYATHILDINSNAIQDFPNVISHHDISYNPNDNTFLTLQDYVRQVGNNFILFDKIVRVDSSGNVLWSWDTYNYIPLSESSSFDSNGNPTGFNETSTFNGQLVEDFTHANSLFWDYNNGVVYLNSRCTNTFYKIDMATGNIVWACGEFGNFTLIDENGQVVSSLWYHSHDVTLIAPDVFTMFDNDFNNITNPNNCRSRMIELTLDENAMTARIDWSWEAPTQYWNSYAGGTTKLPNGDFLGDFGDPTHHFPQNQPWDFPDTGAVFIEVNPAGQIVRTWTFQTSWYVYRVEPVTNLSPSPNPPPPPPPGSGSTFGITTVGDIQDVNDANYKSASPFTCGASGQVSSMSAYVARVTSSGTAMVAIYSDNGGQPGTLLGQSQQASVGTAAGWVNFNFASSVVVSAGTPYWLAIMSDDGLRVFESAPGFRDIGSNDYSGGFTSAWGWVGVHSEGSMSIYATVLTTSTPPPNPPPPPPPGSGSTFGITTVGDIQDVNDANYKSASPFTCGASGQVSSMSAYVARVTSSGTAMVAIYSDNGGQPGTLLGQSQQASVGTAAGWVNFNFASPVGVVAGTQYWLTIVSDDGLHVYESAPGFRDIGSNDYASGFTSAWGWVSVHSEGSMSIYATVS